MKSDWDDAPDYLRSKTKPSPWRMVTILGVGSAITWGVIALFAKPIVINVDQLKQAIHVDGKPLFSQQPAPQPYSEPERSLNQSAIPFEPPKPTATAKSTNQSQGYASIQRVDKAAPAEKILREIHAVKGWDNKIYKAAWDVANNRIVAESVCSNYGQGSFNYRECRKGAKQYFHEQCRAKRIDGHYGGDVFASLKEKYCSAMASFSPMES